MTTFASNVSRLKAVADAAAATGRSVIIGGRAMERTIGVARECGYLDGVPPFFSTERYSSLDRNRTVLLATGSQGEPRAALARMAQDDYGDVRLAPGDRVIFSSRTIPGNEREVGKIINGLVAQASRSSRTAPTWSTCRAIPGATRSPSSTAGSGRRSPCRRMASRSTSPNMRPRDRARRPQGRQGAQRRHGRAGAGGPGRDRQVPHGQLAKDGHVVVPSNDASIAARTKLAFAGSSPSRSASRSAATFRAIRTC